MDALRNFRTALTGIDPAALLAQIEGNNWWNYDDSWVRRKRGSPIYNEDNIVLRYLTLGMERSSQRLFLYEEDKNRDSWTRPAANVFSQAWPIVFDLMRAVQAEHLGHVIITRLPPGGETTAHTDIQFQPAYWQRYQIPLVADPGVTFRCGGEAAYMQPGHAYWFNNQLEHSVVNQSGRDRVSMLVDLRPFARQ